MSGMPLFTFSNSPDYLEKEHIKTIYYDFNRHMELIQKCSFMTGLKMRGSINPVLF